MKKRYAVLLCVAILLAGCPVDTTERSDDLTLSISDQDLENGYSINASVNLGGRPPSNITYHGVKVTLLDSSTAVAEREIGDITTDRHSVKFRATVASRPDRILIKYDRISGADGPGEVTGYEWDPEKEVYVQYQNYTREY